MKGHRGIDRTTNRTVDALSAEAVSAVINGTEWLTAFSVGRRRYPEATELPPAVNVLETETRIFSVELGGYALYPAYLFDEAGNPIPEVAEILAFFAGYRPFRIASWFESTNSMLHGRRPREILASDGAAVVAAAMDHAAGAEHG